MGLKWRGMAFRKKVFVSQKITLLVEGREVPLQALVSVYGAKYVFEESELPEELKGSIGQEVEILYKRVPVRCRVVKETNDAGTVYSFRFVKPGSLLLKQIERDIRENGLPSPWIRALPRLSTEVKHLPVPAIAVLDYEGETLFLNVKNFTLGGLLLEYVGNAMASVKLEDRLYFDLVTNSGDKISELGAMVSHISLEISPTDQNQNRYQLGVRFLPMGRFSGIKYRSLIQEHCLGLKADPREMGL